MKLFTQKRFVYQQPPQPNPEVQSQPPQVDAGKEAPKSGPDTAKETLPTDPAKLSDEIKSKGQRQIASADERLAIFANLPDPVNAPKPKIG